MQSYKVIQRSPVCPLLSSPNSKTLQTRVRYHTQDTDTDTLRTRFLRHHEDPSVGEPGDATGATRVPSCVCRDRTKECRPEAAEHRPREVVSHRQGRAPPGRGCEGFTASCLKRKMIKDSATLRSEYEVLLGSPRPSNCLPPASSPFVPVIPERSLPFLQVFQV